MKRIVNRVHFVVAVGKLLMTHSELHAKDVKNSSQKNGHSLTMKELEKRSEACSEESNASLDSITGLSQTELYSTTDSEATRKRDSSKESVSTAESTAYSKSEASHSDSSSVLNLKHKVTLLRYGDSGTAAVWVEGGEDKSPVIAIDLHTAIDITGVAREVATKKAKENERKLKYLSKTLTTQALAEYAFIVWKNEEGCELDKAMLKDRLQSMDYNPFPMETKNGWSVTVMGTSDYHGELIVPSTALRNNKGLYVHAVRFGSNEKIILRGWTSAKYIKLVGRPFSKQYQGRGKRPFIVEKYNFDPSELFPMSLLDKQLAKKSAIDVSPKQKRFDDEFGF